MRTSLQVGIEQQRAVYETLPRPLLAQIAELHGITIRDFAEIFGISKSHAEEVMNHKTMPSLDLAIRICRYWEVTVEELFGWKVDDDGSRCPLVVMLPGDGKKKITFVRRQFLPAHDVIPIVKRVADSLRGKG